MAGVFRGRGRGMAKRIMQSDIIPDPPSSTTWAGEKSIYSRSMRTPFASLLSQIYGKPVELRLTQLAQPHHDASILASIATEKMRAPRGEPGRVQEDLVTKIKLPEDRHVLNTAAREQLAVRALRRKPSVSSMGTPRSALGQIIADLNLKRVTQINMRIGGRYDKRLSADRAQYKVAKNGITASGPGTLLRQVRKSHLTYAQRAGRRKVGAYGVKVLLGHS